MKIFYKTNKQRRCLKHPLDVVIGL